ncbi:hypothetical protein CCR75_007787 [Bremia lactucae]|uniref:Uncharacterized protein n=1 Tax=Bremia lactucae TaxID=4779 RepID=A0A976FMQ7_BRELC|nr:hypothetical protein CCR75_007787 [Bremia lactucae]
MHLDPANTLYHLTPLLVTDSGINSIFPHNNIFNLGYLHHEAVRSHVALERANDVHTGAQQPHTIGVVQHARYDCHRSGTISIKKIVLRVLMLMMIPQEAAFLEKYRMMSLVLTKLSPRGVLDMAAIAL